MKNLLSLLLLFVSFSAFAQSINPPDLRNRLEHAERTGQISSSDLADLKNRVEYGDRTGELNGKEAQGLRDRISALESSSVGRSANPPDLRRRLEIAERTRVLSAADYDQLLARIELGDRTNELNSREAQGLRARLEALHGISHANNTGSHAEGYIELNSRIDAYSRGGVNRRELEDIDARITQGEINGVLSAGEVARLRENLRAQYGTHRGDGHSRSSNRTDIFIARVAEYESDGELTARAAYNLKRRAEALRYSKRPGNRAWRELEIDLQRNLR